MKSGKPDNVTRAIIRDIVDDLRQGNYREARLRAMPRKQWVVDALLRIERERADLQKELETWWPERNAHREVSA